MLENFDEALSDLSEAIELNPEYPDAYLMRSLIYEYIGDTERADADYERATELDPGLIQ